MIHARKDYNRIQDPAGLIPEDEPVFLIRGRDIVAPEVVEFWAQLAEVANADGTIIYGARRQAQAMREYHKSRGYKIPDMPEGA